MSTSTTITFAERRRAANLTQAQLARAAGCSLSFIGNLEAGAVPKRSAVLPRIEDALKSASEVPDQAA